MLYYLEGIVSHIDLDLAVFDCVRECRRDFLDISRRFEKFGIDFVCAKAEKAPSLCYLHDLAFARAYSADYRDSHLSSPQFSATFASATSGTDRRTAFSIS